MAMRPARSKALVPLLLALAGFGCGSEESAAPPAAAPSSPAAAEPEAPPEPAADAEAPAAAVREPAAVAEAPEWRGQLPADFPADVPHYPGSQVVSAKGTEDLGVAVTFDSADSPDAVVKFYADGLAAAGWQAQTQEIPEGTLIIAEKEDRQAHAVVHAGGQGTLVDLIIVRVQ